MDKASIIAIEEVCKRCHLYTKHCGMLEYPSQCVHSGHFIDGYRNAEKDLALTWEDVKKIEDLCMEVTTLFASVGRNKVILEPSFYEEVARRFNEQRQK